MRVIGIIACDLHGGIGIQNKVPWYIPDDLTKFKHITMGQTVIMGRNTYESLPPKARPLPGRINIVVTNVPNIRHPRVYCTNIYDLLDFIDDARTRNEKDLYVIGGASIIDELFDEIDMVYLTRIMAVAKCDTYIDLPRIKKTFSNIVQESKLYTRGKYSYYFEKRVRKMNAIFL